MSMTLHRHLRAARDPLYRTPFSLSLIWKLQNRSIRTVEQVLAVNLDSLRRDPLFAPDEVNFIEKWRAQQSTPAPGGAA